MDGVISTLDHLLWAAPDLATAVAELEALTGVRAAPGGSHPHLGTHNALTALGEGVYLEVVAPHPELPPGSHTRQFAALKRPALFTWAALVEDAEQAAKRAQTAGLAATINDGSRRTPDGGVLEWKTAHVTDHAFGNLVPFFIDWLDTEHPARRAPGGITLNSFHILSPVAREIIALFDLLGIQADVRQSDVKGLVAQLDTPRGRVKLAGP